jgi:hypothetical protein
LNEWNALADYNEENHFVGFARAGSQEDAHDFSPFEAEVLALASHSRAQFIQRR